jgi:hypothetical protein
MSFMLQWPTITTGKATAPVDADPNDREARHAALCRDLRIIAGTVAGFLSGIAVAWGCGGLLTLMIFYHAGTPYAATAFFCAVGVAIVTFFTWAGNALMKSVDRHGW